MLNETQKEKVVFQLKTYKKISRNWCLQRFISRLGAIIDILKKEGWEFRGEYKNNGYSKDYIYHVLKTPDDIQKKMF